MAAACLWICCQGLVAADETAVADPEAAIAGATGAEDAGPAQPERFLDSITVTATRGERSVGEVTGAVTVIDAETIERLLMTDTADLTRYLPGVYVSQSDPRYGSGGFNIRGVGGNRVMTLIDGVETLEEFEFGHFEVPAFAADLNTLSSVEVLRGGASSLYGSDALGGVVSFLTRDPDSYLGGESSHLGFRLGYSGADRSFGKGASWAQRSGSWQISITADRRDGGEVSNQGDVDSVGPSRTAPDPQQRESTQILAKAVLEISPSSSMKLTVEGFDRSTATDLLSEQSSLDLAEMLGFPPGAVYQVDKRDVHAVDEHRRLRFSLEQHLQSWGPLDTFSWRLYDQSGDTEQRTRELRWTEFGGAFLGPISETEIARQGLLTFEQETRGGELQAAKSLFAGEAHHLLTFGISAKADRFDQLRDRRETDVESGDLLPPTDGLIYPTKYFPKSDVQELGAYLQAEMELAGGRLKVVPGVRYDSYDLDADQDDPLYHEGNPGTLDPVDLQASAVSPKLGAVWAVGRQLSIHGQYSHGFRAPPYSAVNSGFTHFAAGITRLPNPVLRPETSDGLELGLRGRYATSSFSLNLFRNEYDDFIELTPLGFNPATGLIEFQHRNIAAARISGVEAAGELSIGGRWSVHGAWALIRGDNLTTDRPLNSIPPSELVLGLRHVGRDRRWGGELIGRLVSEKSESRTDSSALPQVRPPAYQLIDLTGYYALGERVSIQAGIFNLLDEKYWEWGAIQGREADGSDLDRYTAPGIYASMAVQFRW